MATAAKTRVPSGDNAFLSEEIAGVGRMLHLSATGVCARLKLGLPRGIYVRVGICKVCNLICAVGHVFGVRHQGRRCTGERVERGRCREETWRSPVDSEESTRLQDDVRLGRCLCGGWGVGCRLYGVGCRV